MILFLLERAPNKFPHIPSLAQNVLENDYVECGSLVWFLDMGTKLHLMVLLIYV